MELFKQVMSAIAVLPFVKEIKVDNEMRVASFFCPSHAKNFNLFHPLIKKGFIDPGAKIKESNPEKVALRIKEGNKEVWRALLLIRNKNVATLAISADKGQP